MLSGELICPLNIPLNGSLNHIAAYFDHLEFAPYQRHGDGNDMACCLRGSRWRLSHQSVRTPELLTVS